jgi:hypothetical protein
MHRPTTIARGSGAANRVVGITASCDTTTRIGGEANNIRARNDEVSHFRAILVRRCSCGSCALPGLAASWQRLAADYNVLEGGLLLLGILVLLLSPLIAAKFEGAFLPQEAKHRLVAQIRLPQSQQLGHSSTISARVLLANSLLHGSPTTRKTR